MSGKPEVFDLGQYLSEQTAEGEHDSNGKFTLSQEKAASKLARFALPFEYGWVLKVVQAAVAWDSTSFQVRQFRTFSLFEFCPADPASLPDEPAAVSALLSGKVGGERPLELLSQGLRALVEQAGLSFRLILVRESSAAEQARPIQAGKDGSALEDEARRYGLKPFLGLRLMVAHLPLAQFLFARYLPKKLLNDRPDLRIALALQGYCFLAPIPITLDGRVINRLLSHPRWGSSAFRPLLLSGIERKDSDSPMPVPPDFEHKVFSMRTHPRRAERTYGGGKDFAAWFFLRSFEIRGDEAWEAQLALRKPVEKQTIYYLNHGVVVERLSAVRRTRQTELMVMVDARDLATDLSGLSLQVKDPQRLELRETLREVGATLEKLTHETDFLREDRDEQSDHDPVSSRLTRDTLRQVESLLPRAPSTVQQGVAAAVVLGRVFFSHGLEAPEISGRNALEWTSGLREDLDELFDLHTARIEPTVWTDG